MMLEAVERYVIENLGNAEGCPCCCYHDEKVICMRDHGKGGCCVVSEYAELDHCCYRSIS